MRLTFIFGLAALVLTLTSARSEAAIVFFSASIDGAQANAGSGTGSAGTGSAMVSLDDITGDITLSGSFTGLSAAATVAHIHGPAAPGANGGVLVPMTIDAATSGNIGVAPGATLPMANIADMIAGNTYINIHSSAFPGGEIRGQLIMSSVPEPSSIALLALIGTSGFLRRRRA